MLTVEERTEMLKLISDLTKEAFGFRVRANFCSMNDNDLIEEWNRLVEYAAENVSRELAEEHRALQAWNAEIHAIMTDHGIDKAAAVRWHRQSMNCEEYDFDYYMWSCGICSVESYYISLELGFKKAAA